MTSKIANSSSSLRGKNILLGISAGIAAYKSPELVRLLKKQGANVQVVTTPSAEKFVTHTALQAVSGNAVRGDLWDENAEAAMGHIELARWADIILIAPATANFISDIATGRADSLLATLCLASEAPLLLAPAMNRVMWENRATQHNVKTILERGAIILGPDDGEQACGEVGLGRMKEPDQIIIEAEQYLAQSSQPASPGTLSGKKIVITAGPTREPIDPVRYISNYSSGKQGYAIALAAKNRGGQVILISGPVNLPTPIGVNRIDVSTAQEMQSEVKRHLENCDIFFGVAAVADYRPLTIASDKIKKSKSSGKNASIKLELEENPDIIAEVAKARPRPIAIGFAAETQAIEKNARDKLMAKGLDAIILNDVSKDDIGFNSDENAATIIWRDGKSHYQKQSKSSLAEVLIDKIEDLFLSQEEVPQKEVR